MLSSIYEIVIHWFTNVALDPDDGKKFVAGIFTYKDHVSLEFSEAASFDDPNRVL